MKATLAALVIVIFAPTACLCCCDPDWVTEAKWSQPPVEVGVLDGQPVFQGFDEVSIAYSSFTAADDWLCTDSRPIVAVKWWGSYKNWVETYEPGYDPSGYLFLMYADVPAGVDSDYSHPGELVWQAVGCDSSPEWVGYDDVRGLESVFEYESAIAEARWFRQHDANTVYWLSISAIYTSGDPTAYEWGWSTRPFYFGDAAAITDPDEPYWAPNLYLSQVWDQAFELHALVPEPTGFAALATGLACLAGVGARRKRTRMSARFRH